MSRRIIISCLLAAAATLWLACGSAVAAEPSSATETAVVELFKTRCLKCHGPASRKGGLNLASLNSLARGGESGAVIVRGKPDESLLWQKVDGDEMPPDQPLSADEKAKLKQWIEAGAKGLPDPAAATEEDEHWSFRRLKPPTLPAVANLNHSRTAVDLFLLPGRGENTAAIIAEVDRATLLRRLSFNLVGLPPSPADIDAFGADQSPDACERQVDRLLASPHYGERWGKYWLDWAGYADSNGHFNADSDRPLAWKYRDYVVKSLNADKPLDQFIREQLAGDELAGYRPEMEITPAIIDQLTATHFLRNGQDGTGESDGNPDEVRADRYSAIEAAQEIIGTCLLGLTLQCARCHDHKLEPIPQRDYYQLQAVLTPTFNLEKWVKPNERTVVAPLPAEHAAWQAGVAKAEAEVAARRGELADWTKANTIRGEVVFEDRFDSPLAGRWTNTAPGDDKPGGDMPVNVDQEMAPGAVVREGRLLVLESGSAGNRWLSTKQAIDWTPDEPGAWIQASFDLIADKVEGGKAAERIGFYIGLHDYDKNSGRPGGNLLIDGNPTGDTAVHLDYPGASSKSVGTLGTSKYTPGRRYGIRVTRQKNGKLLLQAVVDGWPEEKTIALAADDLPDGGFGFEFCCGRSFVVDNVVIERSPNADPAAIARSKELQEQYSRLSKQLNQAEQTLGKLKTEEPGKIAWFSDVASQPPKTFLLTRGNYGQPAEEVHPAGLLVLSDSDNPFTVAASGDNSRTTGRRLALANWLTHPGSRPASLMARVLANRVWQQHFGTGIAATSENLGYSGTPPTQPELLEHLATELSANGWSLKQLHRRIAGSAAYRTSTSKSEIIPVRRLDAEAIRDSMLAAAGLLDERFGGTYVPTQRSGEGEVVVSLDDPGSRRRSLYMQQRRTQVLGLLDVFDAPSIVGTCSRRSSSNVPLQSLSLLNSAFVRRCAAGLAERVATEAGDDEPRRIDHSFRIAYDRLPTTDERSAAEAFLRDQAKEYGSDPKANDRAWQDFCQMLLASNAFLTLE